MKKIEAVIRLEKLEELKAEINRDFEISGMTVTQVLGYGNQKGVKEYVRGKAIITSLLLKVKVSFVLEVKDVESVVDRILMICGTGEVGDGKIFISPIEEVIRIRTGQRGKEAI